MAGVPFLSRVLALAGIAIKKSSTNKEVVLDVSSGQTSGTSINVTLPNQTGQLATINDIRNTVYYYAMIF